MCLKIVKALAVCLSLCHVAQANVVDLFYDSNSYFKEHMIVVGFKQTSECFDFAAGGRKKEYTLYAVQPFHFNSYAWHIECAVIDDVKLSPILSFY